MVKTKVASLFGALAMLIGAFAPVTASAYSVNMEIDTKSANSRIDNTYRETTSALVDDIVTVEIWFHNKENEASGFVAHNTTVKAALPGGVSTSHAIQTSVSSTESGTVSDPTTITTQIPTTLEYVARSAKYRRNVGTNAAPNWQTTGIADSILTSGVNLGDLQPCWNFQATVTFTARVKAPALSLIKEVRKVGETTWSTQNSAKPGDELEYLITVKNMGNIVLTGVAVGDNLPPHATYVAGSTKLKNGNFPAGVTVTSDKVVSGGIDIGSYNPGAVGYVWFRVKLQDNFQPGTTK